MADRTAEAAWWLGPTDFTPAECAAVLAAAGPWHRPPAYEGFAHRLPDYEIAQFDDSAAAAGILAHIGSYAQAASDLGGWDSASSEHGIWSQLLRYEDGGHIGWHTDQVPGHPMLDRVSMALSCQLSDPEDYEGGVLEIDVDGEIICPPNTQGTVVALRAPAGTAPPP